MNDIVLAGKKLVRDRRGANLVEYILLVGVVALLSIVVFKTLFGDKVRQKVEDQGNKIEADIDP